MTTDAEYFQQFEATTTSYSPINAYLLALVSQLAYDPKVGGKEESSAQWKNWVNQTAQSWGFERTYAFDRKESQAIMLVDAHKIILGFRGTEEPKDWVSDAKVARTDFHGMLIHKGFKEYLDQIWPSYGDWEGIEATLRRELQAGPKPLWITGHSLGGAAAVLAAATCYQLSPEIPVAGLYTYGQPKVGLQPFAFWLDQQLKPRYYRFVNNNDIVPRVPAGVIWLTYVHRGQCKYFSESGELRDGDQMTWFDHLLDRLNGRVKDLGEMGTDGIKDHSLDTGYIPLTKKQLTKA